MKSCLKILAFYICIQSAVSAQYTAEKLSTIPIGEFGKGITFFPAPQVGGAWPEPRFIYLDEESGTVMTFADMDNTISVFDMYTGKFLRGLKRPTTFTGGILSFSFRDGVLYFSVSTNISNALEKPSLTITSETGEVVEAGLPLYGYSGYPVLFLKESAIAKKNNDDLIILSRSGSRLAGLPTNQSEKLNFLAKIVIANKASYSDVISSTDYFGNTYYHGFDVSRFSEEGKIVYSKKYETPWTYQDREGPYAMGSYTSRVVSGSGIIYYLALSRKGIEIYRCIPPPILGKAYMRLSHEKTMLELAQKGIGETPAAAEKKYIGSLLPGELRVLANASLALQGYFFPDEDIDLEEYFLTWSWYKPLSFLDNEKIVLSAAQKRLVAYVRSIASSK